MKFGFLSLGDLLRDPIRETMPTAQDRLADIVRMAELTEELGFDSFGVGEHHSARWVTTAPAVVLAAIAARTERITLRTGVALLANQDPVRAAEDYATVDLLSGGRLEITAAKGIFPQPWTLFGQDIESQRERLAEAIDLLLAIWSQDPIDWEGRFRPPLVNASVGPRPAQSPPPVWCGVSTAPSSVEFAARRGLPIMVASVFRTRDHVGSLIDHYREQAALAGHAPDRLRVGAVTYLFIREDGEQARRDFETYHRNSVAQSRQEITAGDLPVFDYDELCSPTGPVVTGTPHQAIEKLLWLHERYRHDLHVFHVDTGGQPYHEVKATMELFAAEVAPAVAAATGERDSEAAPTLAGA